MFLVTSFVGYVLWLCSLTRLLECSGSIVVIDRKGFDPLMQLLVVRDRQNRRGVDAMVEWSNVKTSYTWMSDEYYLMCRLFSIYIRHMYSATDAVYKLRLSFTRTWCQKTHLLITRKSNIPNNVILVYSTWLGKNTSPFQKGHLIYPLPLLYSC